MSACVLYQIRPNGDLEFFRGFANAHRGACLVWADFADRYKIYGKPNPFMDSQRYSFLTDIEVARRIWRKAYDHSVPLEQRIVMFLTFDKALVKAEDRESTVQALRKYHTCLSAEDHYCHTAAWANAIEELPEDSRGFGFHHTTVSDNPWIIHEEMDSIPYNVDRSEDGHFWVHEQLHKTNPDF